MLPVISKMTTASILASAGKNLRIETPAPALVHWSDDDWKTVRDCRTRDIGI